MLESKSSRASSSETPSSCSLVAEHNQKGSGNDKKGQEWFVLINWKNIYINKINSD